MTNSSKSTTWRKKAVLAEKLKTQLSAGGIFGGANEREVRALAHVLPDVIARGEPRAFFEDARKIADVLEADQRGDFGDGVVELLFFAKELFGVVDAKVGQIFERCFANLAAEEPTHVIIAVAGFCDDVGDGKIVLGEMADG